VNGPAVVPKGSMSTEFPFVPEGPCGPVEPCLPGRPGRPCSPRIPCGPPPESYMDLNFSFIF